MQVQVSLTIEIEASAGIAEMEQRMQEAGQQAMREALKQAIRQQEDQQVACPHCGQKRCRLEGTTRRVIATVFGRIEVARRRFRCQGCGRRWCPANGLFSELKGGTISQPLQEAARLAGCSWPYRVASQLLKKLSGAQRSRGRDPSVDQSARETASHTPASGGRARLLILGDGCPIARARACGSTAPGGSRWRLGVQPGAARRDGGQGGRGVLESGRSAHAHVLVHVLVERARTQTSAPQAASTHSAALCGHPWSIPADRTTGQSRSTECLC